MTTGPCAFWLGRWWSWGWWPPCPMRECESGSKKRSQAPVLQRGRQWQKKEWCIPKVSAEFVANMEDVLDRYAEPYDPQRPVVCFDETSTQLLAETRPSRRPSPDCRCGRTRSTGGRGPATCSWPVSPWRVGGK